MKKALSLLCIIMLHITFAQETLSGTWVASTDQSDAPKIIEFNEDGSFLMFETLEDRNNQVIAVEGSYYYEDGSDLLVTITWYGNEAKTTKYTFAMKDDGLLLSQIYPDKKVWRFKKDTELTQM